VVDELGRLHQDVAQRCAKLTWMVAGQPFTRDVERWA
jgi:adenosylcobinamide kinase/adenosylcobinamide-phosphate guanylyltransferase